MNVCFKHKSTDIYHTRHTHTQNKRVKEQND